MSIEKVQNSNVIGLKTLKINWNGCLFYKLSDRKLLTNLNLDKKQQNICDMFEIVDVDVWTLFHKQIEVQVKFM